MRRDGSKGDGNSEAVAMQAACSSAGPTATIVILSELNSRPMMQPMPLSGYPLIPKTRAYTASV